MEAIAGTRNCSWKTFEITIMRWDTAGLIWMYLYRVLVVVRTVQMKRLGWDRSGRATLPLLIVEYNVSMIIVLTWTTCGQSLTFLSNDVFSVTGAMLGYFHKFSTARKLTGKIRALKGKLLVIRYIKSLWTLLYDLCIRFPEKSGQLRYSVREGKVPTMLEQWRNLRNAGLLRCSVKRLATIVSDIVARD